MGEWGRGNIKIFLRKLVCLTVTKIFVGQPLSVSLISGIEKVWTREWGEGKYQDFPSKVFSLTVTKNFVGQILSVSLNSGFEKFYAPEVMSRFSVQNILSHSAENFRRGPLLCCVSEKYRWPKSLRIRERVKYKDFQSEVFCPKVPKIFVAEPFCLSLYSGIEKVWTREWGEGEYQDFPSKTCLSHSDEKFRWATLKCVINFGYRKSLDERVGGGEVSRFSLESFLSHSDEKFRWATLKCVINFGYRKILCFRGYVTFFCPKYFVSQCRKIS